MTLLFSVITEEEQLQHLEEILNGNEKQDSSSNYRSVVFSKNTFNT